MPSTKLEADLEALIVDTCTKHEEAHWMEEDYRRCISIDKKYFVKFDHPRDLLPEIETQSYISQYAQSSHELDAPRIAKVIHHFEDQMMMYMVMEYIALADPPPPDLPERTAEAVRWLSEVPAPPGHVFGPLGGGVVRHRFFKDHTAPLVFSSIEALERYIAKGRTLLSGLAKNPVESVTGLSGERLMFTQSDMDASNFGVDEHGKTVLMDFAMIAMLPESFVAYTYSENLATSLGLSKRSNKLTAMATISSCLWMVANPKLGLNEDGYPKSSTRTSKLETKPSPVVELERETNPKI